MADEGPLSQPRLRLVERKIDAGELDEAQRLLGELGSAEQLSPGVMYLATRLLFVRGRLETGQVTERLRELLRSVDEFPEATRMLSEAEAGTLRREAPGDAKPELTPSAEPVAMRQTARRPRAAKPLSTPPQVLELDDAWGDPAAVENGEPPQPAAKSSATPEPRTSPRLDSLPIPQVPDDAVTVDREPGAAQETDPLPRAGPAPHSLTPAQSFRVDPAKSTSSDPSTRPDLPRTAPPVIPLAPGVPYFSAPPAQPSSPAEPRESGRARRPRYRPEGNELPTWRPEEIQAQASGPMAPVPAAAAAGSVGNALHGGGGKGRYSGAPPVNEEVVWSRSRRPAGQHATQTRTKPYTGSRSSAPQTQARTGSGFPPSSSPYTPLPGELRLAELINAGQFDAVLEAIGTDDRDLGPELVLLKARALAGLGRHEAAVASLTRFCAAPLLDPELRASGATLLVELGDHETAFEQTTRAFNEAPEAPAVRLAHAWAALRLARRRDTSALAHTAETALAGQKSRTGPQQPLLRALRACVQAHVGNADRAVSLAQHALGAEPNLVDAHAALALASARLRRTHDAVQAWVRLHELAPAEGTVLREQLTQYGVSLPSPSRAMVGFADGEPTDPVWDPLELAVLAGNHRQATEQFERTCRRCLSELAETAEDQSLSAIGTLAASALTTAPVWQHFAPYDLSLWSVARVRAALGVLYGPRVPAESHADEFPVTLLVGAYLGELLCRTHAARWEGSVMDIEQAHVVAWDGRWSPFRLLTDFLRRRVPVQVELPKYSRSAHPGSDPWSQTTPTPVAPPTPWDAHPWPSVRELPRLGKALASSIVSYYCRHQLGCPLDGSIASLAGLDSYLSLLSPTTAPCEPSAPWVRRLAVLAGAYLGEVMSNARGGQWLDLQAEPPAPDAYRLRLTGDLLVLPLAQAMQRITGRSATPLRDYAAGLLR